MNNKFSKSIFSTGSEYIAPTTHFMCAGDRAMLEMDLDLLKSSQDEIGGWDDNIVDVSREKLITISFSRNSRKTLCMDTYKS